MKYLCLIYRDEHALATMSPEQLGTIRGEYLAFADDIRSRGNLVAGQALQPSTAATTIRVRDGKVLTTDGPFAETKEQLGGFFLIEAKDLNEAIQLAARIPGARFGAVEVRPVMVLDQA
ncbi:MAG TPA: YciI family protein [Gemmatimonadaceae bacterium]